MYPAQALSRIIAVQPVLDAIEREHGAPRSAFEHLTIGQSLPGQVRSHGKGVTLVEIDGQTVAMRLPYAAEVGDRLRLRFAGHLPQPVFLLEMPEAEGAGDTPQLSQAARMLSELVQRLPERNTPPTLTPPAPLLEGPPALPAQIAVALRAALVRSGLFYESHLADWAVGQDTLDGLMQEPQNRLAMAEAARAAGQSAPTAAAPAAVPGLPGQEAPEQKPLNPLHALLSQQLQVLESPQLVWRGEVWPGQLLEWQLRRGPDESADREPPAATDASEAGWSSRLRLTLPTLGGVTVHLHLDPQQAFSLRIVPDDAALAPVLQQQRGDLAERLAAAGCTLQALTVQHEPA